MTTLRTTVIALSDLVDFTPTVKGLTNLQLETLLVQQKRLISKVVAEYHGTIVKGEGDSHSP